MSRKICNSFDVFESLLLGVPTTSTFSEPEDFLLGFLDEDLPNDIEREREEDSVSGTDVAADTEDPVGRRRSIKLMQQKAYGRRSGREKNAKKGQI
jgi:hypothetical protein